VYDSSECVAIPPDQKQFENPNDDCRRKSFGCHQDVKDPDVYYDGAENRQAKGDEPTDQKKQATNDLEPANEVDIAAGKKRVQIFTGHTLWKRWVRKKTQERIGTKENKDQSEKDSGNNGSDFHSKMMAASAANSNTEV
jgi:hypothetical protein